MGGHGPAGSRWWQTRHPRQPSHRHPGTPARRQHHGFFQAHVLAVKGQVAPQRLGKHLTAPLPISSQASSKCCSSRTAASPRTCSASSRAITSATWGARCATRGTGARTPGMVLALRKPRLCEKESPAPHRRTRAGCRPALVHQHLQRAQHCSNGSVFFTDDLQADSGHGWGQQKRNRRECHAPTHRDMTQVNKQLVQRLHLSANLTGHPKNKAPKRQCRSVKPERFLTGYWVLVIQPPRIPPVGSARRQATPADVPSDGRQAWPGWPQGK